MDNQIEMRELLEKYLKNQCSKEERKRVLEFLDSSNDVNSVPTYEEVEALLGKLTELKDERAKIIYSNILKRTRKKSAKSAFWKYASVAAVFIAILTLGFFYQKGAFSPVTDTLLIPQEEAITLELENGDIEVIQEDGTSTIMNSNGKVIGKQQGNQLTYHSEDNKSKDVAYNTLTVPYGKRFDVQLSDGTLVHLNAGTSLKYPVSFLQGSDRKVFLTGEAFFDVSKDTEHPFIVNSETLNIRVLGTEFNVSGYPEDDVTDVVLVEGSVAMYREEDSFKKEKSTILKPGIKGSFDRKSNIVETKEVATGIYTAWVNGELVFRNMRFDNILKKLERHYHIEIENTNPELGDEPFNASFGDEPIEKVLETLQTVYGIQYSIENNKVIIE